MAPAESRFPGPDGAWRGDTDAKETDMNKPLMAKATAVWLVDNTTLSFKQIGDFCGLHELEVQGIADGDVAAEPADVTTEPSGNTIETVIETTTAEEREAAAAGMSGVEVSTRGRLLQGASAMAPDARGTVVAHATAERIIAFDEPDRSAEVVAECAAEAGVLLEPRAL